MSASKSIKKVNIILVIAILILLAIILILLTNNNINKIVISNESISKNNIINSNALTMMYETEAGSGEYQVTSDTMWPQSGYVFNETLSKCEKGSQLTWDSENNKVIMEANTSDRCYVYFDVEVITLANYIINEVYTGADGDNDLYYHDGIGSYTNADQEAEDYSYRYSGENPNNYVCFGSDEATCTEDNFYRIIGVFENQVKLIKSTSYGSYAWDSGNNNTWDSSTKPDIYTTLNSTFLATLNSTWQNKIATHTFKVGGMVRDTSYTAQQYYNIEVGNSSSSTIDNMKIGLMYVSDYGFASTPDYWTASSMT